MTAPALFIFARPPVPGRAKTRLQPALGPVRAAALAQRMLELCVRQAAASWPGPVYLLSAGRLAHPLFADLGRRFSLRLGVQRGGDVGTRMHAALERGIAAHGAAAVMGSDIPHVPGHVLEQAYGHLRRKRPVLGPAEDGGYYFIGLSRPEATLFEGVDWGSCRVLTQTLARAEARGLWFERLPALRDIDTWEDLRQVARTFAPLAPFVQPRAEAGEG